MRLPFLAEVPLPPDRDALVARLEELIVDGTIHHGYLRARASGGERFLFFLDGKAHSAGEALGTEIVGRSIGETVRGLKEVEDAVYHSTDLPLLLCTAVPFRKAPSASIPLELVDPETLLKSLESTEKDAVLVVRRGDARTLVFCERGSPRAVYAAPGETFPEEGGLADRIVEYVLLQPDRDKITLDVYDQIRLPPVADAGGTLRSFLATPAVFTKPREPAWLVVKLRDRVVFHYPMATDEIVVGRGFEADLVLDNLSVSRRHVKLRRASGFITATDLGGANGLMVGDTRVERIDLQPGDEIGIGKYTLVYAENAPGTARVAPKRSQRFAALEKTVDIDSTSRLAIEHDGHTHSLVKLNLTIGSSPDSDIRIGGWFVAKRHAEIVTQPDGTYRVYHLAGWRKVELNGRPIKAAPLEAGDELVIAGQKLAVRTLRTSSIPVPRLS